MPRCKVCPNRLESFDATILIGAGQACVALEDDGAISYAYVSDNGLGAGRGHLSAEAVQALHPELATDIMGCPGSQMFEGEIVRAGLFKRKQLVSEPSVECTALMQVMGRPQLAANVEKYFNKG